MKLILVLVAMGLHHLAPGLAGRRRFRWLQALEHRFTTRFARVAHALGGMGAALFIGLPVAVVLFIEHSLLELSSLLGIVFALAVLMYSLGPVDLGKELDDYIAAQAAGDGQAAGAIAAGFGVGGEYVGTPAEPFAVSRSALVLANERLFGPLFWFVLAGAGGAFIYRVAHQLAASEVAHGVRFRHFSWWFRDVIDWLPARVLALGYALSGSLAHAMERWRFLDTLGLSDSRRVLADAGMGALMHDEEMIAHAAGHRGGEVAAGVKALIGRTLVVALVVLALTTLAGKTA